MSFRFIRDHADRWPIRLMCRVLEVSASGYYAWRNRPDSARVVANRALLADVRRLHGEHHGRYGSPRMHAALRAEGRTASRGRVARLMRRHGIRALAGRRFRPCTTDSRHYLPIAPNLLKQAFVASAPNRIWLADITYIATGEGWLYLAAVLDLATRKIVGWSMRDHMRTELPLAALMMAAQRQRPAEGLICHSDRGSQYASEAYGKQLAAMKAKPSMSRTACCYDNAPMESFFHTLKVELAHQRLLADHGITCSMSRSGNVWDNSAMESFFSSLKTERTARKTYRTRDAARADVFDYIERFYNPKRRHSKLGYLSPIQFEARAVLP